MTSYKSKKLSDLKKTLTLFFLMTIKLFFSEQDGQGASTSTYPPFAILFAIIGVEDLE